jgi:cytochrome P450
MVCLALNPEVQRRARAEVDEALRGRTPDLADVSARAMPYLNGCVYEALRLHPPVPEDHKVTTAPVTLPCGTTVPRGTRLVFCPYAMGRDPRRWPDPLRVRPERWIPFKQPDPYAFPVFQAGPRVCLGRNMALFETKIVAATLLQRFRFELERGEAKRLGYSLMITMSVTNNPEKTSFQLLVRPTRRTDVAGGGAKAGASAADRSG